MLRWVRHKFREIFCTNNCFIFRETACLTFVRQNLDNENHFFVSSPFALRHTKQQQMVFSFESWRFLYLFFYKFYLNTTVENMSILWIDLTNNKGTSLVTFNWKSMSHLAPLSSLTTSPLSPPTPEANVWSSDDTWHVALLSPAPSPDHPHSQVWSIIGDTWLPEPTPRLPSAPDWCMMS